MYQFDASVTKSEKSIRILHALTTAEACGTELMTLRLVQNLAPERFACEVSFLDGLGPIAEGFSKLGVPVHDLSEKALGGVLRKLIVLLARGRYAIIHLYGFRMSMLGRFAARMVRPRPIVVHGIRGLHVTEAEQVSGWKARLAITLERATSSLIDCYIANSGSAVTFLRKQGLPSEKFINIHNGIDVENWSASNGRATRSVPVVICVAKFKPIKRQSHLLGALASLKRRGVPFYCRFVGDGTLRPACEALSARLGLNDRVAFLGHRDPSEVPMLLNQADVFVLPSLWEGMPGAVMEAMAAALPVVGCDVPGVQDLVVHGETGYLAPADDQEELASMLEQLLKDPDLRFRMGQAGRQRIVADFSIEKMVSQYAAVYEAVVRTRSAQVHSDIGRMGVLS